METRKLYYEDPQMKTFQATVLSCEQGEKGWIVTLDRTAFYPEGGGQACDLGSLGDARVLDVREKEEKILHLCDRPLEEGKVYTGNVDWQRRFDLMQQHTGEHILSGIICSRYGYHNVGFHVGAQVMEIDFDGPIPTEEMEVIEELANRAVWENLPVKCWYPSPEELPAVTYRTKKQLPWPVRIVEVPGFDACACCGVHVPYTGQIGMIKILSCIKFHQGVRMELVCGMRAYRMMRQVYEQNRLVSQAFSAKILETGDAAKRMNQLLSAEKNRSGALEKQLFDRIAEAYRDRVNPVHFEEGLTPGSVRELCDRIAGVCTGWAAVFSGDDENGYNLCILWPGHDVKELGSGAAKVLNGRGGGKPGSFQGSFRCGKAQIEAFFRNYI